MFIQGAAKKAKAFAMLMDKQDSQTVLPLMPVPSFSCLQQKDSCQAQKNKEPATIRHGSNHHTGA